MAKSKAHIRLSRSTNQQEQHERGEFRVDHVSSSCIHLDQICELYSKLSPTIKTTITNSNEESISEKLLTENYDNNILFDPFSEDEELNDEKVVLIKFLRLVLRFVCLETVEKEVFLDIIDQTIPLFEYVQQIDQDVNSDLVKIIRFTNDNYKITNDQITTKGVEMEDWKMLAFLMYAWILKGIIGKNYGAQRKYFACGNFGEYSPTLFILILKHMADRKMISNQQKLEWISTKYEQSLIVTIIGFLTDYYAIFVRFPPSSLEKEVKGYVLPQLRKVFPKLLVYLYEISEPPFECIKISNFFTIFIVDTIEFLGKKALRIIRPLIERDCAEIKDLKHSELIQEGHNAGTLAWVIKLKVLNIIYVLIQFTSVFEQEQLLPLSEYLPLAVDILNIDTYHSDDIDSMLQNFSLTTCFSLVTLGRNTDCDDQAFAIHSQRITEVMPNLLEFAVNGLSLGSCALQIVCCDIIKVLTNIKQSVDAHHFEKILSYYHHEMNNIHLFREMMSIVILFSEDKGRCYEFFMKSFNQVRELEVTDEKFFRSTLLTISLLFDMYSAVIHQNNLETELLEFVKIKLGDLLNIGIGTMAEVHLLNSFSRILVVLNKSLGDDMKQVLTRLVVCIMDLDMKSVKPIEEQDAELTLITNNSTGNIMMLLGKLNVSGFLYECKRAEDTDGYEFIGKVIIPKIMSHIVKPISEFINVVEAEKTVWAFNTFLIYDIGSKHTLIEQLSEQISTLAEFINSREENSFYYEGLLKTFLLLFPFYPKQVTPILVRNVGELFTCFNNSFDDVYTSLYTSLVFQVVEYFMDNQLVLDYSVWMEVAFSFFETFGITMNLYSLTIARRVLARLEAEATH